MSQIVSYVKRQKNKTFGKEAFNEVDALVLSQFVYMKFDGLVPTISEEKDAIALYEIAEIMDEAKVFIDERYEKDNKALFKAMLDSERFHGMRLNYYSNIVSVLAETQFSAVTIFLEEGPTIVVFRGTDETVIGWKEDFNMCFKEPVIGQNLSAMYLQQVSKQLPGKFCVAGHSKGGNFAIYSSMNLEDEAQNRIEKVYSFDSPGFRPEILESVDFNRIKDRICKYLPHSSIVGMLLQSKEDYQVVECSNIGFMQHNPYNWRVQGSQLKKVKDLDKGSYLLNETVNEWLFGLNDEELHTFANLWYDIMTAANITTLLEFSKQPGKAIRSLLDAIRDLDDETKEAVRHLADGLGEIAKENIQYYAKQRWKIKENTKEE